MLDTPAIAAALSGLVGFRPTAGVELPAQLTTSRSGLYMQDVSELLTLDVLKHIAPREEPLATWLLRLQGDALLRLATRLAEAKGLDGKVLLPETSLLNGPGNRANTVNKLGRFVGIQLTPARKLGVRYSLPQVSVQFDGPLTEPLTLYLYNDAQDEPLQEITVPIGNRPNFPHLVPLTGDSAVTLPQQGPLWLGYYENDLPLGVRAIQREFTGLACQCAADTQPIWSPYGPARAFSVPELRTASDRTLFDPADVQLEPYSFGLNLFLFAYCDVATALASADNTARLAPAVQMALAVRLLEAIVSSPNVTNLTGRQDVQADARYLLFTTQAKLYGGRVPDTNEVYPSLLKSLSLDLSGLDGACVPQKPSLLSMGSLVRSL